MDCLQRTGEVIVDGKSDVVQGRSTDGKSNANDLLQYMNQQRVTAVLMLNSKQVASFLDGSSSVQLQVTGENVDLDANVLAHSFRSNNQIRSKLLIVVMPGKEAAIPHCMQGVDIVQLSSEKGQWNKEIIARFMQKISLRH